MASLRGVASCEHDGVSWVVVNTQRTGVREGRSFVQAQKSRWQESWEV